MPEINLKKIRQEYTQHSLDESEVDSNPFTQFKNWFREALESEVKEPNAMSLATIDSMAKPHNRIVLLKGFDEEGFTFFTNYQSNKGTEIEGNSSVAVCFFWVELERQIRIEGKAKKLSRAESEEYFKTRPKMSQIGALASNQSEIVPDRNHLDDRFNELAKKFSDGDIPMPETWGGYRIYPEYFEFWQGRRSRLHDRIAYSKEDLSWSIKRLSP